MQQYALGEYGLPVWLSADEGEKSAQDDILTQIRTIKAAHGLPPTASLRQAGHREQVCGYKDGVLVEGITGRCTLAEARQLPAWFWDHRPGVEIRWGAVALPRPVGASN
jgi:hypothetical protein